MLSTCVETFKLLAEERNWQNQQSVYVGTTSKINVQSNSSMHHYSFQRGRFCARSLASCISRSSEDKSSWMFFVQAVRGRPGGRLQFSGGAFCISWQHDTVHIWCSVPAVQQSIDISCPPGPQQQTCSSGTRQRNDGTEGQIGQMDAGQFHRYWILCILCKQCQQVPATNTFYSHYTGQPALAGTSN